MLIQNLARHDSIIASQWFVVVFCNTIGALRTEFLTQGRDGPKPDSPSLLAIYLRDYTSVA
jgi:hypothetical protein